MYILYPLPGVTNIGAGGKGNKNLPTAQNSPNTTSVDMTADGRNIKTTLLHSDFVSQKNIEQHEGQLLKYI